MIGGRTVSRSNAGKSLVDETLLRLCRGICASCGVALRATVVLPTLVLQQPHRRSKLKELTACLNTETPQGMEGWWRTTCWARRGEPSNIANYQAKSNGIQPSLHVAWCLMANTCMQYSIYSPTSDRSKSTMHVLECWCGPDCEKMLNIQNATGRCTTRDPIADSPNCLWQSGCCPYTNHQSYVLRSGPLRCHSSCKCHL